MHAKVISDIRELYEFLAVTKVDGLPPAPSTVSYRAPAGKSFWALGAILLSKDVEELTLQRHQKCIFPNHLLKLFRCSEL